MYYSIIVSDTILWAIFLPFWGCVCEFCWSSSESPFCCSFLSLFLVFYALVHLDFSFSILWCTVLVCVWENKLYRIKCHCHYFVVSCGIGKYYCQCLFLLSNYILPQYQNDCISHFSRSHTFLSLTRFIEYIINICLS